MITYYTSNEARWTQTLPTVGFPAPLQQRKKNAFVLGRFQPLHKEHIKLIKSAFEIAENVLVVIGSANEVVSLKNPFSYDERKSLIELTFKDELTAGRLTVMGIEDYLYRDDKFYNELAKLVNSWNSDAIYYTFAKDKSTTEYISRIPFERVYYPASNPDVDATAIRQQYFSGIDPAWIENINLVTRDFLHSYKQKPHYRALMEELVAVKKYNESYASSPFPPHFVAVDGLVTWQGHILVISRKSEFGNGKWALPGGYLEVKETLLESAKREVLEETGFRIDDEGTFLTKVVVIDEPTRSMRGRMITHVHVWRCCETFKPELTPGDDAAEAFWLPVSEVYKNKTNFFSDHYYIIAKIHPEVEEYDG